MSQREKDQQVERAVVSQGPLLMSPGGTFELFSSVSSSSGELMSPGFSTSASPTPIQSFVESPQEAKDMSNDTITIASKSGDRSYISCDDTVMTFTSRELFGGAITVKLPDSFEDVSAVRQVPDHQEVFVENKTEMSFIVELLAFDEKVPDNKAALHHFEDLAQCNEATNVVVDSCNVIADPHFVPEINQCFSRCALTGRQSVAKFSRRPDSPLDEIQILLCVIRLPSVNTDLLVTLNIPLPKGNEKNVAPTVTTDNFLISDEDKSQIRAVNVIREALQSLKIVDWALFA